MFEWIRRRFRSAGPTPQPEPIPQAEPEVQWVDTRSLQPGPYWRDALSDAQMARLHAVRATLGDADTQSLDEWVDNFRRDADPDRELSIWEAIAGAFARYATPRPALSAAARRDVMRVLLLRSMAGEADVLERVNVDELTRDEVLDVLRECR